MEIFGSQVPMWQIHVLLGIGLCASEVFLPSFVMLPIGLAFFVTAIGAFFGASMAVQWILFAVSAIAFMVVFRKFFVGRNSEDLQTNVDSMVGKLAKLEEAIDNLEGKGALKLYGDHWSARSESGEAIEKGTAVEILRIEGNKVIVKRA